MLSLPLNQRKSPRASNVALDLSLHYQQGIALQSPATEILFGGAAGGGKSHLMRVAAVSWCVAIPGLQIYLFRRELPDLWKNHMEGPSGFPGMLAPWVDAKVAKIIYSHPGEIRFPNGSKIFLCHCQYEKDVFGYQGAEIHVLMIDELTQWLSSMYRYLRGRLRVGGLKVPPEFEGRFPRTLCSANPGGIGHNWVKAGWIDLAKPLQITRVASSEGGMLRQFVPARLEDNPTAAADPSYPARLEGLGNPALVKAMRLGDWNIVAGGALDDVWDVRAIVPRFKVPLTWRLDRTFDWGSRRPFSVLWFAEADGTEATLDGGSKFCPPRGSLVLAHEWYGAKDGEPNVGLGLPDRDIALGIKERETQLVTQAWFAAKAATGPADSSIFSSRPGIPSTADEMAKEGVYWTESDKSPGSRKMGLKLIRDRLIESRKDRPERPGLYVMEHCRAAIAHWPVLPRDQKNPDDVDSKAEDHDYDALRYRILAPDRPVMSIKMGFAH